MVVIEPNSMASHIVKLFTSENSGKIRPIISPAKVSFDKSKKISCELISSVSVFFFPLLVYLLMFAPVLHDYFFERFSMVRC